MVVAAEEWELKTKRKGTLADFLASSPLGDAELPIERSKEMPREIDR